MSFPFVSPQWFWLAGVLPVLIVIGLRARRIYRQRLEVFGQKPTLREVIPKRSVWRGWCRVATLFSLILLMLVLAEPRWGKSEEQGVLRGRDLVIILDLSKSMLAEDMQDGLIRSRWKAAQQAVNDLIDSIQTRGGHRVALVVFAGKPWVLCPLTSDYDHFRLKLEEADPIAPPPEIYPKEDSFESGTRMGDAIRFALTLHDPRLIGFQDILLLTDGDDPLELNDTEKAIQSARELNIPVHVVGLGNPDQPTEVILGDGVEQELRTSQLQEKPLQNLARLCKGQYLPARQSIPDLGLFFQQVIEPEASREIAVDLLPQTKQQAMWFLLPALILMLVGWIGR